MSAQRSMRGFPYAALGGWVVIGFLVAPILVVVAYAVNDGNYLGLPQGRISLRWFRRFFESPSFVQALLLSLGLAVMAVAVSLGIGVPAAIAMARGRFRGRALLLSFFLSPLMLPSILTGLGLFQLSYVLGVGRPFWALLLGHVLLCTPYVIRTTVSMLVHFDRAVEEAAIMLGATPRRAFFEVTMPLIRPGIIASAIFAFIISFDQFPMSLFLVSPGMETLPIVLFNSVRLELDPTVAAASVISIAMAMVVVAALEFTIGLDRYIRL